MNVGFSYPAPFFGAGCSGVASRYFFRFSKAAYLRESSNNPSPPNAACLQWNLFYPLDFRFSSPLFYVHLAPKLVFFFQT